MCDWQVVYERLTAPVPQAPSEASDSSSWLALGDASSSSDDSVWLVLEDASSSSDDDSVVEV